MAGWLKNYTIRAPRPWPSTWLFGELRTDHPLVTMANGNYLESDEFFAVQMRRAGNVLLAARPISCPRICLRPMRWRAAIFTEKDSDGILRRVRAFDNEGNWDMGHPAGRAGIDSISPTRSWIWRMAGSLCAGAWPHPRDSGGSQRLFLY